jgi:putative DNA primase/helicase
MSAERKLQAVPGSDNQQWLASRGVAQPEVELIADAELAGEFAGTLRSSHLWCGGLGWLAWKGHRWASVTEASVIELARAWAIPKAELAIMETPGDFNIVKKWERQLGETHVRALATLAHGILERRAEEFDAHPDYLNTPSGVVDLRTGQLLQLTEDEQRDLLMTRSAGVPYIPGARHEDWDKALTAVPEDILPWLQVRIGNSAYGSPPPDDVVLINQGGGENGKSTFLEGLAHALGDYYVQIPVKALFGDPHQHSTEFMPFRGARLAGIEETPDEDHHLDVKAMKAATAKKITARLMRRDNVTFEITHALVVNTNHEPRVETTDRGTWRRMLLLKWPVTFLKPGQVPRLPHERKGDPHLRERIIAGNDGQLEAALAWIIEGARRWHEGGRVMPLPPARVIKDTEDWQARASLMFGFGREYLEPSTEKHVMSEELFGFFNFVITQNGHKKWSEPTFRVRFEEFAKDAGWEVEKKKTRRDAGALSRPPCVPGSFVNVNPGSSYHAWHGVCFPVPGADRQSQTVREPSPGTAGTADAGQAGQETAEDGQAPPPEPALRLFGSGSGGKLRLLPPDAGRDRRART